MSFVPRALHRLAAMLAALAISGLTPPAAAVPADVGRLEAKLPAAAFAAIRGIFDHTASQGLPTAPLVATALEGAARNAPVERIVGAVRAQAASLHAARQALGRPVEAEIVAGASVLRAGVSTDSLARLRGTRSGSLVVPLVVMADMVARGVPVTTASGMVIAAAHRQARDADLMRLRENVADDIRAGASPEEAALVRTQAFLTRSAGRGAVSQGGVRLPKRPGP